MDFEVTLKSIPESTLKRLWNPFWNGFQSNFKVHSRIDFRVTSNSTPKWLSHFKIHAGIHFAMTLTLKWLWNPFRKGLWSDFEIHSGMDFEVTLKSIPEWTLKWLWSSFRKVTLKLLLKWIWHMNYLNPILALQVGIAKMFHGESLPCRSEWPRCFTASLCLAGRIRLGVSRRVSALQAGVA